MNKLAFALLFASSLALADVGPRPAPCSVPASCRACSDSGQPQDGGVDCRTDALNAGLVESECSDRSGAVLTSYFCPKGTTATRGCSSVDVLGLSALAALLLRRRR